MYDEGEGGCGCGQSCGCECGSHAHACSLYFKGQAWKRLHVFNPCCAHVSTHRYASFDYEEGEYRQADLVRLDILAHGKVVDALARLVHVVSVMCLDMVYECYAPRQPCPWEGGGRPGMHGARNACVPSAKVKQFCSVEFCTHTACGSNF